MFADYYCKRFGFGKPETTFEQATVGHARRKGAAKGQQWEAIMSVRRAKCSMLKLAADVHGDRSADGASAWAAQTPKKRRRSRAISIWP